MDDNGNAIKGSDDATVTINDLIPAISVVKTVSPTSFLEPTGDVTFTVVVKNESSASSDPLTITALSDSIYGDLSASCLDSNGHSLVDQTVTVGGSVSCTFMATISGNAGYSETDTVTAYGKDDEGNEVFASDTATVTITNVPSAIELSKTPSQTTVNEPGGNVTFTFLVSNISTVDTVMITSLTDDTFGDLNGQGDCSASEEAPQAILPGGVYSCSVTVFLAGNGGDVHTNVAAAAGVDDDGLAVGPAYADATVNFIDVPPAASLSKTATMVVATFEVVVTNDSLSEVLSLEELIDDKFGDITQLTESIKSTTCVVPQSIAVGGSYSCTFDAVITNSPHTNTVTGKVSDDENESVFPNDDATVSFQ
jgi:hypothetical protein